MTVSQLTFLMAEKIPEAVCDRRGTGLEETF